jgi:dynein heavy chain, axonemal
LYILTEYNRISASIIPVIRVLLQPALLDFEFLLVPGLTSLSWSSLNIGVFKESSMRGLNRLSELVSNANAVIENRIEPQLRCMTKTELVTFPASVLTLDAFVDLQVDHVRTYGAALQLSCSQAERATHDLCTVIRDYAIDPHIQQASADDFKSLVAHYASFAYSAILASCRTSLLTLNRRITGRSTTSSLFSKHPVFVSVCLPCSVTVERNKDSASTLLQAVDIVLIGGEITTIPNLDSVQETINRSALVVLGCTKSISVWSGLEDSLEPDGASAPCYFDRLGRDLEVRDPRSLAS